MILRTYICEDCGHTLEVQLTADQWNIEPPDCGYCAAAPMAQEFKPFGIGGSVRAKATALAETIASEDYNVADLQSPSRAGRAVRYKDTTADVLPSNWTGNSAQGALETAVALGRETRLRHGNGLDVLQSALKSGAQRDLIADSRRRSIKVW
jgi:hypothetical protein